MYIYIEKRYIKNNERQISSLFSPVSLIPHSFYFFQYRMPDLVENFEIKMGKESP